MTETLQKTMNMVSKDDVAKIAVHPEVVPPGDFTLPDMSAIWPTVMQMYTSFVATGQALMPHSSPQVQSDFALGLAVTQAYTIFQSYPAGSAQWYQSLILLNFTLNNVKNINQLPFGPKSTDDATLLQWFSEQIPDLSQADLYPTGRNGVADYVAWGMGCRQILIVNGWDVSGVTANTNFPINNATLTVSGRFLTGIHGNNVILRGVDLPLLDDWNFPGSDYLSELAQSGANAVRIQWYINYGQGRPAYSITDLGNFIDRCVAAQIIPIVMLSDETCQADPNLVNSVFIPWWTTAEVVNVLKPRQACLILNLANELGYYKWADNPTTALTTYANAYKTALASMRKAGYTLPLMIDAPDCGTTLEAFTSVGAELVSADPQHNILLSTHAYWAAYDGRPFVSQLVSSNLPIVFGEIANKQDETAADGSTEYGYYDLDGSGQNHPATTGYTYQAFLTSLVSEQVGWLAWSWYPDACAARQMTSDGTFAALTPYGQDIVNNATYGLKATAVKYLP